MKIIVMTDANDDQYKELAKVLDKRRTMLFDTACEKADRCEYGVINLFRDTFLQMENKDFALVRYSGNSDVSRLVGDECSDMIVILDYNKQSPNYMIKPVQILREVVEMTKNFKNREDL